MQLEFNLEADTETDLQTGATLVTRITRSTNIIKFPLGIFLLKLS